MFKVHIISDLDYGDNEHTEPSDINVPDVDLIICNGNIASLKRSLNFGMKLAESRPDTHVVWNPGDLELYRFCFPKYEREGRDALMTGQIAAEWWRPNFHYSEDSKILNLRNGEQVDVLPLMGWPRIHSYEGMWEDTWFFRNIMVTSISDPNDENFQKYKPSNTSHVNHFFPLWATQEYINNQHEKEYEKAKKWELAPTSYKILITHFNPYKDTRFYNTNTSPYQIHLENGLWVTSDTKCESVRFLGARLVSNPGRGDVARSHVVTVNT